MRRRMMKSKIHRATVTDANLHYVGSITVDRELMDLADLYEYEQVAVVDIDNGARLETYVIEGEPGSGAICLNGAAARAPDPPRRQGDHHQLRRVRRRRAARPAATRRPSSTSTRPTARSPRTSPASSPATASTPRSPPTSHQAPNPTHPYTHLCTDEWEFGKNERRGPRPPRARVRGGGAVGGGAGVGAARDAGRRAHEGRAASGDHALGPGRRGRRARRRRSGLHRPPPGRHARRRRRAVRPRRRAGARRRRARPRQRADRPRCDLRRRRPGQARARPRGRAQSRGSCTPAARRPVRRSSAHSSKPCARPRPRSTRSGSPSTSSSRTTSVEASSPSTRTAYAPRCGRPTSSSPPVAPASSSPSPPTPRKPPGDGVAMALRAGVAVADVEFVQFHPTALHHPAMPRPLLSEALRGHGALLRDAKGEQFVDELLPRDQGVEGDDGADARAGRRSPLARRHEPRRLRRPVPDDRRGAARGRARPDEATGCRSRPPRTTSAAGSSPTSTVHRRCPGLWAAGETACNGVHGANRLASNSLLDGMVFAPRVVEAIERGKHKPEPTGAMRAVLGGGGIGGRALALDLGWDERTPASRDDLQGAMTRLAGVLRSATSLGEARDVARRAVGGDDVAGHELRNLATVAQAVIAAALAREESRGSHTRIDFRETRDDLRLRFVIGSPP